MTIRDRSRHGHHGACRSLSTGTKARQPRDRGWRAFSSHPHIGGRGFARRPAWRAWNPCRDPGPGPSVGCRQWPGP
ncbi:hypothetical protein ACFFX0_21330 [Citricoccus parietis]|uniref:Uncharacterized protein n=1 Tax=Citricoccus parietis TaxID=592307 RepID=A0ABV5G3U6_9MICC